MDLYAMWWVDGNGSLCNVVGGWKWISMQLGGWMGMDLYAIRWVDGNGSVSNEVGGWEWISMQ